ncbi:MAG: chemotaxis protein CheC [Acidobacteriota bacterium]|nr:chemotaxis protein CheC [Acidobacteriota bacterium]
MNLSETQIDLLKETFNIGVGQAAASLSELAGGEEIMLSVPTLEFKTLQELETDIRHSSGDQVCGVSETFRGPFDGTAMMLYSEEESLELVKIMLGETIPVEELSEMEGEALTEVGNIVLNAVISALADLFESEIITEVPLLHTGECAHVLEKTLGDGTGRAVLHLQMDFSLASQNLEGHIGFFLDVASVDTLVAQLEHYFRKMLES